MKLEDLRKLYEAPELPKQPKMEAITGTDLAHGPDSAAMMLRCIECDLVMTITDPASPTLVRAHCPRCDTGCSMCKRLRDADGNTLRIRATGTEKRRVCDQCSYDYYDILADRFTSVKIGDEA
jgi:hypothetical protein